MRHPLAPSAFPLGLVILLLNLPSAFAQIQLGGVSLSGNGCTGNRSAQVGVAPDGKALSIIFDGFEAEVGSRAGVRMARSTCTLQIAVAPAPGTQFAIARADVRGYHQLATRAYAQFTTSYALVGPSGQQKMPTILRRVVGPANGDFTSINRLKQQDLRWSSCGGAAEISVQTSIVVQSNEKNEVSLSSVDSVDLRHGSSDKAVEFQILTRPCP
jgi:hypothetical protein